MQMCLLIAAFQMVQGMCSKSDFITAMGGPATPVGTGQTTAQDLADTLEMLVASLTHPGVRVYPAELNRERFWCSLVAVLDQP